MLTTPIKDRKVIMKVRKYLNKRDRAAYDVLINTGRRGCDIVPLKKKDLKNKSFERLFIKEKKTKKPINLKIEKLKTELLEYSENMHDNDYLFPSRNKDKNGNTKHITTNALRLKLKEAFYKANIQLEDGQTFGLNTCRKSYVYFMIYYTNDVGIVKQIMNHSSCRYTKAYAEWGQEQIDRGVKKFMNLYLQKERVGIMGKRKGKKFNCENKYNEKYADIICGLRLLNPNNKDLAKFFGIDMSTFYVWLHRYPKFKEQYEKGKSDHIKVRHFNTSEKLLDEIDKALANNDLHKFVEKIKSGDESGFDEDLKEYTFKSINNKKLSDIVNSFEKLQNSQRKTLGIVDDDKLTRKDRLNEIKNKENLDNNKFEQDKQQHADKMAMEEKKINNDTEINDKPIILVDSIKERYERNRS
jgi:hypothetical protein